MITSKDVEKATGLSRQGIMYRLKQMEEAGEGIRTRYVRGKVGSIRVYSSDELEAIVNWKSKKPGRKRNEL